MPAHRLVVTARDAAILASLAEVRFLTVEHLQWLHWPERWRAGERATRDANRPNRSPKNAYTRVAGLATHGLLVSLRRSVDRGVTEYRQLPDFNLSRLRLPLPAAPPC